MPVEINLSSNVRAKRIFKEDLATDAALQNLLTKTPEQINDYLDANVTDLDSARGVMKRMMRLLIYVAKQSGI